MSDLQALNKEENMKKDDYKAKRKLLWDDYEAKRKLLEDDYKAKLKPLKGGKDD